jgi:hypothetical protein
LDQFLVGLAVEVLLDLLYAFEFFAVIE